ncbi:hypothetical protein [Paraburkholderia sp. 40]|uniref:hypothetical protein n=1 Tax=unclassified Paraburkholderia TaxID=2615204 RepID=UPI003D1D5C6A
MTEHTAPDATRLIERHAKAARALEHMYTEKNVERLNAIGEELEAALAATSAEPIDEANPMTTVPLLHYQSLVRRAALPRCAATVSDEREAFDAEQHQVLIGYDINGDAVFGTDPEARAAVPQAGMQFKPVGRCECAFSLDECEVCEANREAYQEHLAEQAATPQAFWTKEQVAAVRDDAKQLHAKLSPGTLIDDALPRASDALKDAGDAVTLTGAQLAEALDFIAPDRDGDQLETEATIQYGFGHSGQGIYCWITEYPEEGAILLDGTTAQPVADEAVTYDDVVSICDAHGINLPVEYVEHAVEIANFAARAKD